MKFMDFLCAFDWISPVIGIAGEVSGKRKGVFVTADEAVNLANSGVSLGAYQYDPGDGESMRVEIPKDQLKKAELILRRRL